MQLSVLGCGYLGAVHAVCMAEMGHEVIGIDVDAEKIKLLANGEAPFYEPQFDDYLQRNLAAGRLRFTTDPAELAAAQVHFIAVGTPQISGDYAADMSYVEAAVATLAKHVTDHPDGPVIVAGKSTVPVGSAERLAAMLEGTPATLMWNPEFLREGFAVDDTMKPDRIVYGVSDDVSRQIMDDVYRPLLDAGVPRLVMNYPTAELVKVAANSFLATKISFINAMAELCEATGADVTQLAEAIGYDDRIGKRFLRAGIGFGGGCLPKDIRAFMARARELEVDNALVFLREVDAINLRRRERAVELATELCGGRLGDRRIAVLGAAFKPDSDDVRDSPALDIATRLQMAGADVCAYDPAAGNALRALRPEMQVADSVLDAVSGAHVVMLLTEWDEFKELSPADLAPRVAELNIVDGRNVLVPQQWREAGWRYRGMGRPLEDPDE